MLNRLGGATCRHRRRFPGIDLEARGRRWLSFVSFHSRSDLNREFQRPVSGHHHGNAVFHFGFALAQDKIANQRSVRAPIVGDEDTSN
jgi:hypothetical protein